MAFIGTSTPQIKNWDTNAPVSGHQNTFTHIKFYEIQAIYLPYTVYESRGPPIITKFRVTKGIKLVSALNYNLGQNLSTAFSPVLQLVSF